MFPLLPPITFNSIPFSFRRGGADGKWGIWLDYDDDVELLVSPGALAETLAGRGVFPHFILNQDPWGDRPLPIEILFIEDIPSVAETYIWRLRAPGGDFGREIRFPRIKYIEGVLKALRDLYEHLVIAKKDSAYLDEGIHAAECFLLCRDNNQDYLLGSAAFKKARELLSLPIEAFETHLLERDDFTLKVGGRTVRLNLSEVNADEFRHDLEHLLFRDETSLFLRGADRPDPENGTLPGCGNRELVIRRTRPLEWEEGEDAVLLYLRSVDAEGIPIAGFCREEEVLSSLCALFLERFPGLPIGHPLRGRIRKYPYRT